MLGKGAGTLGHFDLQIFCSDCYILQFDHRDVSAWLKGTKLDSLVLMLVLASSGIYLICLYESNVIKTYENQVQDPK